MWRAIGKAIKYKQTNFEVYISFHKFSEKISMDLLTLRLTLLIYYNISPHFISCSQVQIIHFVSIRGLGSELKDLINCLSIMPHATLDYKLPARHPISPETNSFYVSNMFDKDK